MRGRHKLDIANPSLDPGALERGGADVLGLRADLRDDGEEELAAELAARGI